MRILRQFSNIHIQFELKQKSRTFERLLSILASSLWVALCHNSEDQSLNNKRIANNQVNAGMFEHDSLVDPLGPVCRIVHSVTGVFYWHLFVIILSPFEYVYKTSSFLQTYEADTILFNYKYNDLNKKGEMVKLLDTPLTL